MKKFMLLMMVMCLTLTMFVGCTKNDTASNEITESEEVKENEAESETTAPVENKDDKIVIVDSAGRTVELKKDIKKISLMNTGSLEVIRALDMVDKIASVPSIVCKNTEYFPEENIQNKPVVTSGKGISYEALVELNPDVVITYSNKNYCDIKELEDKLKGTDIKIVGLNFYKPEAVTDEIRIMGKILNSEEKANELADFIQGNLDIVNERVSKMKEEDKVAVYYESIMGDYKSAAKGSGYHDLLTMAGAKNVFKDEKTPYPTVSSEDILMKDPEVIIKGDRISKTEEDMQNYIAELASRPGWSEFSAVKENKLYLISSSITTDGIRKPLAICRIAKTLYPDVFSDLDIEAFEEKFFRYQKPGKLNTFMYPVVK